MIRLDDGSGAVPDGVTGPVGRVLVVGTGPAGLTCANALVRAGVECVVLEARDRIGGWVHTVDRADLGASWIHQPEGNPLRRYADAAGIACHPGDPVPGLWGTTAPRGGRSPRPSSRPATDGALPEPRPEPPRWPGSATPTAR